MLCFELPKYSVNKIKCAELDIGRNSVIPCISERKKSSEKLI